MNKKILFGLTILFTLTVSLSAQTADVIYFVYQGDNCSEQMFIQMNSLMTQEFKGEFFTTNKLPKQVTQAINNNLRDYILNIGDVFSASFIYQDVGYYVLIRIIDAKNSSWQFYAWLKY